MECGCDMSQGLFYNGIENQDVFIVIVINHIEKGLTILINPMLIDRICPFIVRLFNLSFRKVLMYSLE
jgi:hypothetical protein